MALERIIMAEAGRPTEAPRIILASQTGQIVGEHRVGGPPSESPRTPEPLNTGGLSPEALAQALGNVLRPFMETQGQQIETLNQQNRVLNGQMEAIMQQNDAQREQTEALAQRNELLRQEIEEIRQRRQAELAAERLPQAASTFEQTIITITTLQGQPASPDRDRLLQEATVTRDRLLQDINADIVSSRLKDQAYTLYRIVRIDVPPSEKSQRLEHLLQEQQRAEVQSQETGPLWTSLERRGLDRNTYGGIIDYIHRENFVLIRAAIDNPRDTIVDESGVSAIWNFVARDKIGVIRPGIINNFDQLRQSIENERRERPRYISSRGNYLFPIEFIVDGVEELEEAVEDTLIRLEREVLSGGLEAMVKGLQERQSYGQKAMESFMREFNMDANHPVVLKSTSKLNSVAHILGAAIFLGLGKKGFKNALDFLKAWAEGFRTVDVVGKEINVHSADSIYFDEDGMMALGLDELQANDGIFWRYGSESTKPPTKRQRESYQKRERARMIDVMATNKLKPVDELLTTHPKFINLRTKMNRMDPTGNSWRDYVTQAQDWERKKLLDENTPDYAIKFEHPLARALTKQERRSMYMQVTNPAEIARRKKKAEIILKRGERLCTALMIDSRATSARLKLKDGSGNETGEVRHFASIVRAEVMKIVEIDAQRPLGERVFKAYHVLKKLGLVDFPAYNPFNVGADDSEREDLLAHFEGEPALNAIIKAKTLGPNAKTTIVRWIEEERRMITLVERAIRRCKKIPTTDSRGRVVYADGTDYYNYPGYDTPGGGVKAVKNDILFPYYGISRDTVEANGLIPAAYYGVQNVLDEFGREDLHGFMVWQKRNDEIELAEEGPAFKNPRDMDQWIGRIECAINQSGLWTGAGVDDKDPEGLLVLPLSGAFQLRAKNLESSNWHEGADPIGDPINAINKLKESGYADYLATVGKVYSKLEHAMKARRGLENVYGKAAGTATFINTLTWYDFLDWMDYYTEEYRGKYGYAIDAKLTLPRYLANTNLYEDRVIYYEDQWRKIMVGEVPTERKDSSGHPVYEKKSNGLLDLLPDYLKQKITVGAGQYQIDPIPVYNDRFYPAVLDLSEEGDYYHDKYKSAPIQGRGKLILKKK